MTNWLDKIKNSLRDTKAKLKNAFSKVQLDSPKDYWHSCKGCTKMMDKKQLKQNFYCCPNCSKPQIVSPRDRFQIFFDNGQYEELNHKITTNHDPLDWEDLKKYKDKVKAARKTYKQDSAVLCAEGFLNGSKVQAVVFNSQFLGGSFGIPESQVFLKAIDYSVENKLPFIVFVAGGGMRVTSGALSLMGMPKVVIGFNQLKENKIPSISMFCDPLAGGLTCIFYMSDFSFAEDASTRVIFSGRKTIESVIGEKLDGKFGTAEHCMEKGFLDAIIPRSEHREKISNLLSIMLHQKQILNSEQNAEASMDTKRPISAA